MSSSSYAAFLCRPCFSLNDSTKSSINDGQLDSSFHQTSVSSLIVSCANRSVCVHTSRLYAFAELFATKSNHSSRQLYRAVRQSRPGGENSSRHSSINSSLLTSRCPCPVMHNSNANLYTARRLSPDCPNVFVRCSRNRFCLSNVSQPRFVQPSTKPSLVSAPISGHCMIS